MEELTIPFVTVGQPAGDEEEFGAAGSAQAGGSEIGSNNERAIVHAIKHGPRRRSRSDCDGEAGFIPLLKVKRISAAIGKLR